MQAYAFEQLASANEVAAARARHLRYFSTIGIPAEYGFMSARVVSLLERGRPTTATSAPRWSGRRLQEPCAAMRLLAETKDLFFILGQADGSRLAELILRRCPERNRDRARLMIAAGHFAFLLGDVARRIRSDDRGGRVGRRTGRARGRRLGAFVPRAAGDVRRCAREGTRPSLTARAIQQETGDLIGEARSHRRTRPHLLRWMGRARPRSRAPRGRARDRPAAQDRWSQGQANLYLGILAESSADQQAASSYFREAVECQRPYGDVHPASGGVGRPGERADAARSGDRTPDCRRRVGRAGSRTAASSRRSSGRSRNGPAPQRPSGRRATPTDFGRPVRG